MQRFLAIIWDPKDPDACQAARVLGSDRVLKGRKILTSQAGLLLADLTDRCSQASLIPIGGSGAIFGTVFKRTVDLSPASCLSDLPPELERNVLKTSGACLLADYWGSYVAFFASHDHFTILPDPTSSIPCFYRKQGPLTLVFSHLEDCPASVRKGLTLNHTFVSQVLAYDKIQNGQTGLNEIRELQGGHALMVTKGGFEETICWDPRRFASLDYEPSVREASERLRHVTSYVVQSWGMSLPKVSVSVSGGLDSAIVAAFLVDLEEQIDIESIHFKLEGEDPSETAYVRLLAGFLGLDIKEVTLRSRELIPPPDSCPLTVRPYREFLAKGSLTRQAGLSALAGRTTFTGQGGDHLFLETRSPLGLADHLLRNGPVLHTARELLNAAHLSNLSIWQVLHDIVPAAIHRKQPAEVRYANLASRRTRVNRLAHENLDPANLLPLWARSPEGVPPAKFAQVVSLVHMMQIRSTLLPEGSPPFVHPLISQPLIETCLETPAYTLCAEGWPRGLIRQAMADRIPEEIRLRRSKGDASRFFVEQLNTNQPLLESTLLEGALVAGGFIDRSDIERFLQPGEYRVQTFGRMILVYYAIECWLRRWQSELRAI